MVNFVLILHLLPQIYPIWTSECGSGSTKLLNTDPQYYLVGIGRDTNGDYEPVPDDDGVVVGPQLQLPNPAWSSCGWHIGINLKKHNHPK